MELSVFIILAAIVTCSSGSLVGTWWSKNRKKKRENEGHKSNK